MELLQDAVVVLLNVTLFGMGFVFLTGCGGRSSP